MAPEPAPYRPSKELPAGPFGHPSDEALAEQRIAVA